MKAQGGGDSSTPMAKAHRRGEGIGLTYCLLNVRECVLWSEREGRGWRKTQQGRVGKNNDKQFTVFKICMLPYALYHLP